MFNALFDKLFCLDNFLNKRFKTSGDFFKFKINNRKKYFVIYFKSAYYIYFDIVIILNYIFFYILSDFFCSLIVFICNIDKLKQNGSFFVRILMFSMVKC